MFFNFLVNLLHLEEDPSGVLYVGWYDQAGALLGALVPVLTSLLAVFLFYYVWGRLGAPKTIHWYLVGCCNALVAFVINLFAGRASLARFVDDKIGLGEVDAASGGVLWIQITSWPFTQDLWFFALNAIIWCVLFYFVFSWILKRWSPVYNIPFGRKYKKAQSYIKSQKK